MKIYILDDDNSIIRILEQIITEKNIGNIIGMSNNSLRSIKDIHSLEPDIIIMDLLMPELDGISFIEHVRKFNKFVKFIMISQVTSKDMISKAYEKGVTFYINKPINVIPGNKITMKGVDFKVLGTDDRGYTKVMYPGYDYKFPGAKYVIETPIKWKKFGNG